VESLKLTEHEEEE